MHNHNINWQTCCLYLYLYSNNVMQECICNGTMPMHRQKDNMDGTALMPYQYTDNVCHEKIKVIACSCDYIMYLYKYLQHETCFLFITIDKNQLCFHTKNSTKHNVMKGSKEYTVAFTVLFDEKHLSHEKSLQNSNLMMGCTLQHWTLDICLMKMYSMRWQIPNRPWWCIVLL